MRTGLPYEAFASKASAEGLFVVRGESHDGSGDDEVFLCVRGEY
jgi:hypothetical protein